MDWKLLARTFAAIFIAELGDKTQLATLALTADAKSKLAVFLGSASALVATSLLAVLAGEVIARWLPPAYLNRGAGVLFIGMGVWMLVRGG